MDMTNQLITESILGLRKFYKMKLLYLPRDIRIIFLQIEMTKERMNEIKSLNH